jgi:DNA-binding SARP family transcriptional activator
MTELQLRCFGAPLVSRGSIAITGFHSGKAQALLYYLAMTGRSYTRPTLAGLLWSEMPEANALMNLRKALTNLRQLVGSHLHISRQEVAFNRDAPYWLDVAEFETAVALLRTGQITSDTDIDRLAQAVELYRGDFLEGFYVHDAPDFETWLLGQRARLRDLFLQALHTVAVYHAQQEAYATAIDYTRRLLALEPWREEGHRRLMLLLARSMKPVASFCRLNWVSSLRPRHRRSMRPFVPGK